MKRSLLVLFATVFIISIGNVFGQTTVSDTLQSDDTWELINSPYQVTSDVIVASGVTLTIEPGVEVQFDSGTSLIVDGALNADGTDSQNILFTSSSASPSPGDWVTVRFTNTSDVGSTIDHAVFEYGGEGSGGSLVSYATGAFGFDITNSEFRFSNRHGIDLRASSPFIQHSVFRDNSGYGIFSDLALNYEVDSSKVIRNSQGGIRVPINATPTITATTIDTNGVGIYMDNGSTAEVRFNNIRSNNIGIRVIEAGNNSPLIEDNTFGDNSNWALINEGPDPVEAEYNYWGEPTGPTAISNPTGTGDDVSSNVDFDPWLSGSGTLPVKEITENPSDDDVWSADTVYVIANGITLAEFDTLTIAPGTAVKFENQVSFNIDGTLIADGKPDSVIVFTSLKSDIYGGDTNQDARNSKPSPGDWRGLDLTDFNTGSIFDYVNISYAGYSNTPALEVSQNNVSLSNMFLDNNNDVGIQISGVPMVFQNIVSNANNSHGIEMRNISADLDSVEASFNQGNGLYYESDADNTGATLSISRSVFNENNGDGIFIDDQGFSNWTNQPALDSLTNSEISFNGRHGLNIEQGWGSSIYIANNTFEGNSKHGATIYHVTAFEDSNRVHNNEFIGNGKTGIRTTSARFSDNTFDGNEFGIGYWGRLGYSFLNDADQDNNSFTNNTYNNALELYANQLRDTLAKDFPEDITSNVFMFNDIGDAVVNGNTLVIEPGVIIKTGHSGNNDEFTVDNATLIAKGTDTEPIVFTSYRDHNWGGKTNALSDTNSAQPDDWSQLYLDGFDNPTNTKATELEYVIFQYGDHNIQTNFRDDNNIQNTWSHIESRHADRYIEFRNMLLTLEDVTIENHGLEGIRFENRIHGGQAELVIRNSVIRNNGHHGVETDGNYNAPNAIIRELSNSVIEGNGQDGVRSPNGRSPMTFQFNSIHHNAGNGIFATVSEAGTDTVLTISGNSILHNGGTGILSSRAIIVDDTLQYNQIAIGVTGELSKAGTVNSEGNFYRDNVITDNTIDSVISVTGTVNGILGGTWPEGYTRTVLVGNSNNSDVNVNSGDSLVVSPGTIFKGRNNNDIDIEGTLLSIGEEDNKIIFTSFKDDTFGGNTNRDTTDVIPEPGDWRGFDISDAGSDSSRIKNTIIRYADDNLYLDNTEIVIDSSFISYADDSGIRAISGANPIIRTSDIHHNNVGIEIDNNANPFIHLNNIYDNGTAIHQDGNTDVIAEFNYWGASTGPFVDTGPDQNLSGTGNEIYIQDGTVDYRPFHTGRNGILLGDVTENGSITAFDASLVLQHTVGSNNLTGNALAAADVSANGSVSAMDASYILQFVVGNISGFPGQGKRVTYDYNNALTLSYEGTPEETDISIQNTGEAPVQALEMDIVIPENPVQKVELVDTPAETNMNLEFSIQADTIRIAMASAKTFDEAQSIGTLRLIHAKDSRVERLDEIISYDEFIVNETAVTEHMNEVYTSSEEIAGVPEKFDLKQNYPNPFNPTTNIAYDLPQPGEVKLQVYNMLGQLVQTVTDKRQKAGSYSVKWDASRYSSGTYLLRIEFTGEDNTSYSQVRKMLLIK